MGRSRVAGLAEAFSLFDSLPQQAQDELTVELAMIGRETLALQQAAVAKDTGALEGALTFQLQVEKLRVRVGLLNGAREAGTSNGRRRKALAGGPFYGRFVEFGRKEQVVLVTRHLKRRVTGNGRTSKRRVIYDGKPYPMRVKAMAARPFVHLEPQVDALATQRLADFWGRTLGRSGNDA